MGDEKRETIKSYDKNAVELVEKFKNLKDLYGRSEFKKFLDLLKGKKILDIGCGAGDHAVYFFKQGLEVVCIDLSNEMIKLCKEKGLNAFVMDLENPKFEDESFDGLWAVTSLLHVKKEHLPKVLNNLSRLLKEKGIFYVCVKEGEGERYIDDGENMKRFFAFWKKDELLKLFEKQFKLIGFKEVKLGKTNFLEFFFKKKFEKN